MPVLLNQSPLITSRRDLIDALERGLSPKSRDELIDEDLEDYTPFLTQLAKTTKVPGSKSDELGDSILRLKDIFKTQADRTGTYLSNSFRIAGYNFLKEIVWEKNYSFYREAIPKSPLPVQMGFIQAETSDLQHTHSMPVFAIDDHVLEKLKPHDPETMLTALAKLLTTANHDLLHHITSDQLNYNVARHHILPLGNSINKFWESFTEPGKISGVLYENFMIRSQARLFHLAADSDAQFQADYFATADTFFNQLERIMGRIDNNASKFTAFNYLADMALYAMIRLYPVKCDEMEKYFERKWKIYHANIGKLSPGDTLEIQDEFLKRHDNLCRQIEAVYYNSSPATQAHDIKLRQEMITAAATDTDRHLEFAIRY